MRATIAALIVGSMLPSSANAACPAHVRPPFTSDVAARIWFGKLVDSIFGPAANDRKLAQFFAPGYRASLNGTVMDFNQERQHFAKFRQSARDIRYKIGRTIATCDGIAESHEVDVVKLDGSTEHLHAMSFITFVKRKVIRIDEVAGTAAP
jgi:hypothetical protein